MTEHVHDPANITNPEHGEHHVITPKTYAIVFATLLTLTATTVVAAFINLGIYNPVIALGIACTKAVVVTLSLSDYISRAWGLW